MATEPTPPVKKPGFWRRLGTGAMELIAQILYAKSRS